MRGAVDLTKLPPVKLGLDVLSREGELPEGAVRRAENVLLTDSGGFASRPNEILRGALPGARSLWKSRSGTVLCAAGTKLYRVTLASTTTFSEIFDGLDMDAPVSYADAGAELYFATPSVLGKITDAGLVRRPGVANLIGAKPTLAVTTGGLLPGTYGVAYSLTNDLGEESGLSSTASIILASGGGIALSTIVTASHVSQINVYVTSAGGEELRLHSTQPWTATPSIRDQTSGRAATKVGRDPMPAGQIVRFFNGRLYVASGKFIYVSDPFDRGLYDVRSGWLANSRRITLLEPVRDGIFVGDKTRTVFYRGAGPEGYSMTTAIPHGAFAGTGRTVVADAFDPEILPDRATPAAAWLGTCGLVIGRPDGSISIPQYLRVAIEADEEGCGSFVTDRGISQAIFSVPGMVIGDTVPEDSL